MDRSRAPAFRPLADGDIRRGCRARGCGFSSHGKNNREGDNVIKRFTRNALAATFLACSALTAVPALAETPKDTLVEAWQIDDMISLDPAEIFEFTAAEYQA